MMQSLRKMVEQDAAYGSSVFLDQKMQTPFSFESGGRRSPHPDGRVDPAAFGLTQEMVRNAKQDEDRDLLVVRFREIEQTEIRFSILEDLLGGGAKAGQELLLHQPETQEQWLDRAKKMAPPYKLSKYQRGSVNVVLVERGREGPPVLKVAVPDLRGDGPTVRTIRGWVEDKENGDGEPRWPGPEKAEAALRQVRGR